MAHHSAVSQTEQVRQSPARAAPGAPSPRSKNCMRKAGAVLPLLGMLGIHNKTAVKFALRLRTFPNCCAATVVANSARYLLLSASSNGLAGEHNIAHLSPDDSYSRDTVVRKPLCASTSRCFGGNRAASSDLDGIILPSLVRDNDQNRMVLSSRRATWWSCAGRRISHRKISARWIL